MLYQDAQGKTHVDYFLGPLGRLPNVARRLVAVDEAGRVTPIQVSGQGVWGLFVTHLAFSKQSAFSVYNPTVDLAHVKEFRLETRPYQIVEFRNIQLQPRGGAVTASASDNGWREREEADMMNMRRISQVILEYTVDHDGTLPSLKTVPLLERDLAPYLKQQEKFPDPRTRKPFPVLGPKLYVSPLTGRPYRLSTGLSGKRAGKIAQAASTVLFSDTLTKRPAGETRWVLEAFADGHVKGRAVQ